MDVSHNLIKNIKPLSTVLHKSGVQDINLSNNLIEDKQLEDLLKVFRPGSDHLSKQLVKLDLSSNLVSFPPII